MTGKRLKPWENPHGTTKQPAANLQTILFPTKGRPISFREVTDLSEPNANETIQERGVLFSVLIGTKDNLQRHLLGLVLHCRSTDQSLTGVFSIVLQSVLCLLRGDFFFLLTFSPVRRFLKVPGAGCN